MRSTANTPGEALAYVTDCNLATIERMASRRSRSERELKRQISIAQQAIDWMIAFDVDFSATRAVEAVAAGGVEAWVRSMLPSQKDEVWTESLKIPRLKANL